MRVCRALARLCGRDARAPGRQAYPKRVFVRGQFVLLQISLNEIGLDLDKRV